MGLPKLIPWLRLHAAGVGDSRLKILAPQLGELLPRGSEVIEEQILVGFVGLDVLPEARIPDEGHVTVKHHQLASLVLKLLWTSPLGAVVCLLEGPLLLLKETIVLVRERGWGQSPWTPEARAVGVAVTDTVGT